jgi:DNA-binding NtrC family response regulator
MGQAEHTERADERASGTVLVVEDEVLIRMATADHLRSKGYRVIEAETADEAVLVLQTGESIDVVFADVQLPGSMGGLSLAVWIHTHFPDTQVILTSGNATVLQNLRSGATVPFVSKPYDPDHVAEQVLAILSDPTHNRSNRH